jgi:CLIP-associating protein 1/2
VDHCLTEEAVIDGVVEGMDLGSEERKHEGAYRSIILGLSTLHQTILAAKDPIPDDSLVKVAKVVSEELRHPRPGVRKQATELSALLNVTYGAERLQKLNLPPQEGSLNLLTYFMARHNISQ